MNEGYIYRGEFKKDKVFGRGFQMSFENKFKKSYLDLSFVGPN
jgi:hypothetical protein